MTEPQQQRLSDFRKIIVDFTKDVLGTFPELQDTLHADLRDILKGDGNEDMTAVMAAVSRIFEHCKSVYPMRFFDILYMNTALFAVSAEANESSSEFLPGMNFANLWLENISEKTRETIWKYLQLVLFAVVSDLQDGNSFGDAASLFEAINGDEFKAKLESTMKDMQDFFQTKDEGADTSTSDAEGTTANAEGAGINLEDLPDPKSMHEHINSMMNGKLGKLAREIAEETAADLNINPENAESVNDVFKKLIQNPTKLMSLVKNVGTKLDEKLKAGDMKESDLMKEASDIMQQMKNMPGMGNLQSMFSKMGMPGMAAAGGGSGGKSKVDVNAMQAHLARNYKTAKSKEKMLERLAMRQQAQQSQQQQQQQQQQTAPAILVESTFQKGEAAVKSFATDKPPSLVALSSEEPKKKSKHKKKKKTTADDAASSETLQ
jgi:hypothetical protein